MLTPSAALKSRGAGGEPGGAYGRRCPGIAAERGSRVWAARKGGFGQRKRLGDEALVVQPSPLVCKTIYLPEGRKLFGAATTRREQGPWEERAPALAGVLGTQLCAGRRAVLTPAREGGLRRRGKGRRSLRSQGLCSRSGSGWKELQCISFVCRP